MEKKERVIFDPDREGYYDGHCLVPEHDNYYCNIKLRNDTVGNNHFMYCKECKICWWIGKNLYSSWHDETDEDWNRNHEIIKDFEFIE